MPTAIYLLGHTPYPPVSGGAKRAANIIDVLSERFDVTVLAADDTASDGPRWAASARRLLVRRHARGPLIADTLEGVIRGRHALLQRSIRAGVLESLEDALATMRPELVILGRPFVGPFLEAALRTGAHVVVEADESLPKVAWGTVRSRYSPTRDRVRALIEAVFVLGRMERASYPRATEVWVSSDRERAAFSSFVDPDRLRVVPNVVDIPEGLPVAGPVTALAFVGSYFYPPNEAAALELIDSIAPAVRERGGPRTVVLVGPAVTPGMIAAAARDREVRLLGEVPDVRAPLREAGVLVVPVRAGGGTRVKILEGMAAGVPVVSTRLGIEGIAVQDGDQVLLAETAKEFADQLLRLESDAGLRAGLVQRAYGFVSRANSAAVIRAAVWSDPPLGEMVPARG